MNELLTQWCRVEIHQLSLASCKLLGLPSSTWLPIVVMILIAVFGPTRRAAIKVITWPFKFFTRRWNRRKGWPLITNVTGHTDRPMYGRKDLLRQLRAILVEGNPAARTDQRMGAAAINGQGGVGKTRLAQAYIEEYGKNYETVWHVKAESAAVANESLALLGRKLGCTLPETTPPRDRANDALNTLAAHGCPALIVYDNVVAPKDIEPLRIDRGKIHYLITLRYPGNQEDWANIARSIPLGTLEPDDAVKLLKEESGREGEDLEGLAEDLGYLALALLIAAKTLKKQRALTVAEFRENLERYLHVELGEADYDRSVYGAVMVSYDRIPQEAQALLHLLAFLGPDDLWFPMINWPDDNDYPEPLKQAAQTTATLSPLFSELHDAGLVELVDGTDGQFRTVHRLTQAVIRAKLKQDKAYDIWATAAVRLVHTMLPTSASNTENWPRFASMQPHVEALLHNGPETGDGGKTLDSCLSRIGSYLGERGDAAGSLPYAEKSLALSEALYGEESDEHASAQDQLGRSHNDLENYREAETLLLRAVELSRTLLPNNHPTLAGRIGNLAIAHNRLKKFADAEGEYTESLRITESAFGAGSPVVAGRLDNLGVFRGEQKDWDQANELHQRALDIRRATRGELHQSTAKSYYNCARMEWNRGNSERTLDGARRAVAISHHLGIEGGFVETAKSFLIAILDAAGQNQEADALREGDFASLDSLIEQLEQEYDAGRPQRDARTTAIITDMEAIAKAANFDATAHIHEVRTRSQTPDWGRQDLKDAIRERNDAASSE